MANTKYESGMYVRTPKKPEWGTGRVLAVEGQTVTAAFRGDPERGVRRIGVQYVPLVIAEGDGDPVLADLPPLSAFEQGWRIGDPNHRPLWRAIAGEFTALTDGKYPVTPSEGPLARFMQLHVASFGTKNVHYEWLLRSGGIMDVALHVELNDQPTSLKWLEPVAAQAGRIAEGTGHELRCGPFGDQSAQATFTIPCEHEQGRGLEAAPEAARTMVTLVERTLPICGSV
jgi:hypothetical protein